MRRADRAEKITAHMTPERFDAAIRSPLGSTCVWCISTDEVTAKTKLR